MDLYVDSRITKPESYLFKSIDIDFVDVTDSPMTVKNVREVSSFSHICHILRVCINSTGHWELILFEAIQENSEMR